MLSESGTQDLQCMPEVGTQDLQCMPASRTARAPAARAPRVHPAPGGRGGVPQSWAHELGDEEVSALVTLWLDAAARGWTLRIDADAGSRSWGVFKPGTGCAVTYEPPTNFSAGVVRGFSDVRTLLLTGVATHRHAVDAIRWFCAWPDGGGEPRQWQQPASAAA